MATLTEFKTKTLHYFRDENDLKQGEYKSWYENGQLLVHCFYVDGLRHGEYKSWYSNGQLCAFLSYVDGARHGEYKSWYSNGKIDRHYLFINDTKLGINITNITNITHKDKFLLNLKYGDFPWLP